MANHANHLPAGLALARNCAQRAERCKGVDGSTTGSLKSTYSFGPCDKQSRTVRESRYVSSPEKPDFEQSRTHLKSRRFPHNTMHAFCERSSERLIFGESSRGTFLKNLQFEGNARRLQPFKYFH